MDGQEPIIVDIRPALRRERERLGLSSKELGQRAGISPRAAANLERYTADPRLSTVCRLIAAGVRLAAIAPELEPNQTTV